MGATNETLKALQIAGIPADRVFESVPVGVNPDAPFNEVPQNVYIPRELNEETSQAMHIAGLTEASSDQRALEQAVQDVFAAANAVERAAKRIGYNKDRGVRELVSMLRKHADEIEEFIQGPLSDAEYEIRRSRV